ncbi:MAG: hypothetical protein OER22_00915 [Gammaproteobacteria bacterium]|nr:hypothetical protein [Gammaproteobacteria bacterium]MDH3371865.1 hypothetical protein [Gammaproteobacteria bacterium]MDH3407806.1 hypothetical protein [Gammaproteobacteria bacterium]MDH3551153.1 hypothetical protein [Gammaproteobacteria bacterium]
MAFDLVLVLLTAAITSALTIAAVWFLYQRYLKQLLVDWIDRKADELGEKLKARVREGVHSGIKDGLSEVGGTVVKKTKESAVKSGLGMLEDSMGMWFRPGRKSSKKKDDDDF